MTGETMVPKAADRRPHPWRNALILMAIAFLTGLVAMGWAMNRFGFSRSEPSSRADGGDQTTLATPGAGAAPQPAMPVYPAAPPITIDARIADLEARLSGIDVRVQAAAGNASRAEGLLIAFAARRALDRGMQLGYLEAQLRERFGATQPHAVAVIINAARAPVTLDDLRMTLDQAGPDLVGGGPDEGWWDAIRREASDLVVVRRKSAPSPAPGERLARAKQQLIGDHVDVALAEVARMPGRDKAGAWIAAARRYIESRQALDIIETAAIVEARDVPAPEAKSEPKANDGAPASDA